MKFSEQWLREWVNPEITRDELLQQFTMAGFEVDDVEPVAAEFSQVMIGQALGDYLQLDDVSIALDVTPNRGDCLSVQGIAREVGVLNRLALTPVNIEPVPAQSEREFSITIDAPEDCPLYVGRVIENIDPTATTPIWMVERLRRSGIRSLSPVVDVTNYVLMELGQPLHAFDLDQLNDSIVVRRATNKETLTLLDEQTVKLHDEILLIADKKQPLAIAGIMGGLDSSVTADTKNIFLEAAFFKPEIISGRARHFGLHTDSSHRFERGVDLNVTRLAIERATQLLLDIVGGTPGPVTQQATPEAEQLQEPKIVSLRYERIERVLGFAIPEAEVLSIFEHFGFSVFSQGDRWEVTIPSYRFDLNREEDLIEEVARIYGYDQLPVTHPQADLRMQALAPQQQRLQRAQRFLVTQGFFEAITYSFVDPSWQQWFSEPGQTCDLVNPISPELGQMRVSLWPGLLQAVRYNQYRQQDRVRLFEQGLCFQRQGDAIEQHSYLAGVVVGACWPEQWAQKQQSIDYYDLRLTVENVLRLLTGRSDFEFIPAEHKALHPGQSARIMLGDTCHGSVGMLHPRIQQQLELQDSIGMFELQLSNLPPAAGSKFTVLSKYPSIRRDLSFFITKTVTAQTICATVKKVASDLLQSVQVFDIYEGPGVPEGEKSVALALILQHSSRTLVDEDVNAIVAEVITALQQAFAITLRD